MTLADLAWVMSRTERLEWPDVIRDHFDWLALARGIPDGARPALSSFEAVSPRLRPRVVPAWALTVLGAVPIVHEALIDGLVVALVVEVEGRWFGVPQALAAGWDRMNEELFAIAVSRLVEEAVESSWVKQTQHAGADIVVRQQLMLESTHFGATQLLRLEDHIPRSAELGALVRVECRHGLRAWPLLDPLSDTELERVQQGFGDAQRNARCAGPVFPGLLWWHDGEIEFFDYENVPPGLRHQSSRARSEGRAAG